MSKNKEASVESINNVAIIGCGFGGMTLALFLKRINIKCTIYEARDVKKSGIGGGFNIAVNGMTVFDALGLADKVKQQGTPSKDFLFLNQSGSVIVGYDIDENKYGQPCVSIWRENLMQVVLDKIEKERIPIIQKRLVKVADCEDFAELHFDDESTVKADLVIGADGARSVVRHSILPSGPEPEFLNLIGVGGIISQDKISKKLESKHFEAVNFVFTPPGMLGFGGFGKNQIGWWTVLPKDVEISRQELQKDSTDEWRCKLKEKFQGNLPFPLDECIEKTDNIVVNNIHDLQTLPYWFKNRIVLIGDAAHTVSPNSIQGVSMAIEDSMYLAKCWKENKTIATSLEAYESGRRNRVESIVKEGRERSGDKEPRSWLGSWIREWFIWYFVGKYGKEGEDWRWSYKIVF